MREQCLAQLTLEDGWEVSVWTGLQLMIVRQEAGGSSQLLGALLSQAVTSTNMRARTVWWLSLSVPWGGACMLDTTHSPSILCWINSQVAPTFSHCTELGRWAVAVMSWENLDILFGLLYVCMYSVLYVMYCVLYVLYVLGTVCTVFLLMSHYSNQSLIYSATFTTSNLLWEQRKVRVMCVINHTSRTYSNDRVYSTIM